MELVLLCGPVILGLWWESCEMGALRSPATMKNSDGGTVATALCSCFHNFCLVSSLCLLCGAYAAMMWSGDSVVLKVAVSSLPESGLREVMVGVILGDVTRVTPV